VGDDVLAALSNFTGLWLKNDMEEGFACWCVIVAVASIVLLC